MYYKLVSRSFLLLCLFFSLGFSLKKIETEHFTVVFNKGAEFWANKAVLIAEEVWDDLAIGYKLLDNYKKIIIQIVDAGDQANGYAIFFKNKVAVFTTQWNYRERSGDRWMRNVIIHELAHIFSIKAASKDGFFNYFTVNKASEYENPNINLDYTYLSYLAPKWWVEGTAQFESACRQGDHWDTHRDMLLRMAVLEDDLLDLAEMSSYDFRYGFYPEMVYNQGFSLTKYIGDTYGEDAVREIGINKSFFHFNQSLRKATGKGGQELYNEWVEHLQDKYQKVADTVNRNLKEGELFFDGGYQDMYGVRSPDGKYVAFTSNKGSDVGLSLLYILDTETGDLMQAHKRRMSVEESGMSEVNSESFGFRSVKEHKFNSRFSGHQRALHNFSDGFKPRSKLTKEKAREPIFTQRVFDRVLWFPDSKKVYYSRYTRRSGAKRDIYVFDIEEEREAQITWQARALDPALSPDGKTFAYINNASGIQNLVLVDADGKNTRFLTNFNDGTQLYTPCWTQDGKNIIMGIMNNENRDIVMVNAQAQPFNRVQKRSDTLHFPDSLNFQEDLELQSLVYTAADERDPFVSADNKYLYYASDRTGIFNIYRMDLLTREVEQLSNVLGGAMAPTVDNSGTKILYTGFYAANFNLFELDITSPKPVQLASEEPRDFSQRHDKDLLVISASPGNGQYGIGEFKPQFTLWRFDPFLSFKPAYISDTVGLANFRLGLNVLTGDVLENFSMYNQSYIAKDFNDHAGPSWSTFTAARVNLPTIFGENRNFSIYSEGFFDHQVIKSDNYFAGDYSGDFSGYIPDAQFAYLGPPYFVPVFIIDNSNPEQVPILAGYQDDSGGSFRYDRKFTSFGLMGYVDFNRYHFVGLRYIRSLDKIIGDVFDRQLRLQFRALTLENKSFDSKVTDITDSILNDPTSDQHDFIKDWYSVNPWPDMDYLNYYDMYLYKSHMVMMQYGFNYIRPSFAEPDRMDRLLLTAQFVKAQSNVEDLWLLSEKDTVLEVGGKDLIVHYNANGHQSPLIASIDERKDYFSFNISSVERFPLPPNKNMLYQRKNGAGFRHFLTGTAFLGTFNRKFNEYAFLSPLKYRTSHFLSAYPYSYNPYNPIDTVTNYVQAVWTNGSTVFTDSIPYTEIVDDDGDILWGNGIAYYGLEYTLEFLSGLAIPGIGMAIKGLYITPYIETANLWNRNWRDFQFRDLNPFKSETFLSDGGVRVDFNFTIFDTWESSLSFNWAHRLSLGDMLELKDGKVISHSRDVITLSFSIY